MSIAVACLRLSGRRLLDLDEEVRKWLPAAPAGVTVRELLNHTAGLADYPADGAYQAAVAAYPAEPWEDLEQILAVSLAQPRSEPGHVRYCNAGYWMLGAILERATRTPLPDTLTAEVFGPAGMTGTAYPDLSQSITAGGYSTLWAGPAGAVWSTVWDLDKFLAALLSETLLDLPEIRQFISDLDELHWTGRPGFGSAVMVGAALVKAVYALPTWSRTAQLIDEHAALRDAIGGAPSQSACYRFGTKLREHGDALARCIDGILAKLRDAKPEMGQVVAIDGSDLPAYATFVNQSQGLRIPQDRQGIRM